MDWGQVITVFAIILTNLGTVIALHVNLDSKVEEHRNESINRFEENRRDSINRFEEHRKENNQILIAIQQEMKDFHGRLCAIEALSRNVDMKDVENKIKEKK